MSDSFTNLALRSIGMAEVVRPRLPAFYEPPQPFGALAGPASIASQGLDQKPPEVTGFETDAQTTSTTDGAESTLSHDSSSHMRGVRQPRISSLLQVCHDAAGSETVPPGGTEKRGEEAGTNTVAEARETTSRTTKVQVRTPRSHSSEVRVVESVAENESDPGLRSHERLSTPPVDLSSHEVSTLGPIRPLPADRGQPPPPKSGLSRASQPSVSPSSLPEEPRPKVPDGVAIALDRKTTNTAGSELHRGAERLSTTREGCQRVAEAEPSFPMPQVLFRPLTAATRAEARHSSEDYSPSSSTLFASSLIAPRFGISTPAAPIGRLDSSEPTVQVTIGRIEVRAMSQPPLAPRERTAAQVTPLDEYLRQRSKRGRE